MSRSLLDPSRHFRIGRDDLGDLDDPIYHGVHGCDVGAFHDGDGVRGSKQRVALRHAGDFSDCLNDLTATGS